MTIITINANIVWTVFQDPKSHYYIGICNVLKMSLQGKTIGELHECIDESLDALFHDLIAKNEFELFLREHKWQLQTPLPKQTSRTRFEIPYNIERRGKNDLAALFGK